MAGLSVSTINGTTYLDIFPFMKYIPGWIPGAGFKRAAEHARDVNIAAAIEPWAAAKKMLAPDSVLAKLLDTTNNDDVLSRNTASAAYLGVYHGAVICFGLNGCFLIWYSRLRYNCLHGSYSCSRPRYAPGGAEKGPKGVGRSGRSQSPTNVRGPQPTPVSQRDIQRGIKVADCDSSWFVFLTCYGDISANNGQS